jgi:hypothetical protein
VEPESVHESLPQTEGPKPESFFSRLGGVYVSPRTAFQEIGGAPTILVPIIVLVVIGLLSGFYLTRSLDLQSIATAQMERAVDQGRMTKEQLEQQLPMVSRLIGTSIMISAALGSLLISLAVAGYAKLFSAFAGAENRFKTVFCATIYAVLAVSIVQSVLLLLILHFKGPEEVDVTNVNSLLASNLGAVLAGILGEDALPQFVMSLARSVDIFAIWLIVLLAIGYSSVSRKLKTTTAATWLAVTYGVIAVARAVIASIFGTSGSG